MSDAPSIGIIGGADGPTAIYLSGSFGIWDWLWPTLLVLLGLCALGFVLIWKKKHRQLR